MARNDPQVNIRLPVELKERLEADAARNQRSFKAEIVSRLESSFFSSVIVPETLAARVESYARDYGRTLNEEVVLTLERRFPAPRSPDERFAEVLSILGGLRAGGDAGTAFDKFTGEVLRTLRDIANGEIEADPETKSRVTGALENWEEGRYGQQVSDFTANMNPDEIERYIRTGDDTVIVDPPKDD